MTKREFFENVINAGISEEMSAFATGEIEMLDKRNERAKNSPKRVANEELIERIANYLRENEDGEVAAMIAGNLGESTNKISSLLTTMAKRGMVTTTAVKGTKGYRNLYKLVVEE